MLGIKKSHCLAASFFTLFAIVYIIIRRKCALRAKKISDATRQAANESSVELDYAVAELKRNLEGKSADQLERSLDSIVQNTKSRIDRIAAQLKNKVHSERITRK
ncbi:MAG: hypothetical protein LBI42_11720 [Chitinispirillales bacterium]|jgi:hypothetical protein|nr:hypothetical protein [Chitinispirillales bacterium]